MKNLSVLCLSLVLGLASFTATAKTQYVSDVMRIVLRAKPSEKGKLIRTLPSGTALTMKGVSTGEFSKVTDPEGDTGWVLTRFLMEQPAANTILPGVQSELQACQQQRDGASSGLQACQSDSARQINSLQARTRELEATLAESQRQIAGLRQQQEKQADRELREWFVTGAAVLAGGVILGLIIGALQKRRKPSAWS